MKNLTPEQREAMRSAGARAVRERAVSAGIAGRAAVAVEARAAAAVAAVAGAGEDGRRGG